jgi:hypothetical protein
MLNPIILAGTLRVCYEQFGLQTRNMTFPCLLGLFVFVMKKLVSKQGDVTFALSVDLVPCPSART